MVSITVNNDGGGGGFQINCQNIDYVICEQHLTDSLPKELSWRENGY